MVECEPSLGLPPGSSERQGVGVLEKKRRRGVLLVGWVGFNEEVLARAGRDGALALLSADLAARVTALDVVDDLSDILFWLCGIWEQKMQILHSWTSTKMCAFFSRQQNAAARRSGTRIRR